MTDPLDLKPCRCSRHEGMTCEQAHEYHVDGLVQRDAKIQEQAAKLKEYEKEFEDRGHAFHDAQNESRRIVEEQASEIEEYLSTIIGLRKEKSEIETGWQNSIEINRKQEETVKILTEALAGTRNTLARYHRKDEGHYIGEDDPKQRCEGCGTIEHADQTLDRVRGK